MRALAMLINFSRTNFKLTLIHLTTKTDKLCLNNHFHLTDVSEELNTG